MTIENSTTNGKLTRQQMRRLFKRTKHWGVMQEIAAEASRLKGQKVYGSAVTMWLKSSIIVNPFVEQACRNKAAELVAADSLAEQQQVNQRAKGTSLTQNLP